MTEAKQLRLYGFITVPLLAMLSTTPIFLTAGNNTKALPIIWIFAFGVIGLVWQLNITLYRRFYKPNSYLFYLFSFTIVMAFVMTIRYVAFDYFQKIIIINQIGVHPPPAVVSVLLGLINNVFTLIVQYLIRLQHKHVAAEKEIAALRYAQIMAQFNNLKTHIQPHFLFNALNTLKVLIKKNPIEAEIYVLKISDFLRASLIANDKKVNTVAEELKMAETYLDIQNMRFKGCIILEKNIDPALLKTYLPVLTLQTLFENALKHNILSTEKPLHLIINTSATDKTIEVVNSFYPKTIQEGATSQTGLRNLNDRFEWLGSPPLSIRTENAFFLVKMTCLDENAHINH